MKVKIDNQWYEVGKNCKRIMVELTPDDKRNITNMAQDATKYAMFDGDDSDGVLEWMTEKHET